MSEKTWQISHWSIFARDPAVVRDLSTFENQPVRTVVIKNWPNESFLYHVFLRLNTGSVPLSPRNYARLSTPDPSLSSPTLLPLKVRR